VDDDKGDVKRGKSMTTRSRLVVFVAVMIGMTAFAMTGSTAQSPTPPLPANMLAVGDSFSVGFASGAPDCIPGFVPCPAVSWSTGSDVGVASHYERIRAGNPAITAINAASPGAMMSGFASQVATGTAGDVTPEYVTVMLGAGDICFATTSEQDFRTYFRAGMDALVSANSTVRVLVASVWNFESLRQAVVANNPSATWSLCQAIFDTDAPVSEAVMNRITSYNTALAAECATYPGCRFDGGALYGHSWASNEVSEVDNLHPSLAGQAMISRVLWNAGYWAPDQDTTDSTIAQDVSSPDMIIDDANGPVDVGVAVATPRFTG
jgi:lysophospholipase L1-like esterase